MKRISFPWIATGIGLVLVVILIRSGAAGGAEDHALPLLTLLFLAEFGFILTAVGAVAGFRTWLRERGNLAMLSVCSASVLLAIGFLALGVYLWRSQGLVS